MSAAPASLPQAFTALLRRDFTIAYRRRGEWLRPLLFFVISIALFAFAAGPDPVLLATIAPAIIWVAALLATLLALDGVFRADYDDGALEQMLLSPHPPTVLALARTLSHWLLSGAPLVIVSPLLAGMLNLPQRAWPELLLSLLLGTPALSLIGAIGVALTLAARASGVLLALLVLPLYIPVLIFGAGAVHTATLGGDASAQLLLLGAILLLTLALAPATIVAGLRASLN